jgi:hypothetical protein
MAMKDRKKKSEALTKNVEKPPIFQETDDNIGDFDDLKINPDTPDKKNDDDDFNIGFD